jgi:hypothetical protein
MYYKHSGRFSIGGLAIGTLIGSAGALILAYAYGRGSILIEDERFAFLATLAFGGLIGVCAGYGMVWGKVRNQRANLIVQAVVSLAALYVSWAVWVVNIFHKFDAEIPGWVEVAQHPGLFWRAICYINQYGTWSLGKGEATKGGVLWMIWVVEAAIVIAIAMSVGYEILRLHAFCERCESWCRRGAKIILSAPQNTTLLKRQLEANDWRSLESLTAGNKGASHLEVVLDSCEQCHQLNTMSLTYTAVFRNKLRQTKVSNTKIVQHLLIDPAQAENLKQHSMKVAQAAMMAVPKVNAATTGKR